MNTFAPNEEIYAVIPEGYGFVGYGKYTLVAELDGYAILLEGGNNKRSLHQLLAIQVDAIAEGESSSLTVCPITHCFNSAEEADSYSSTLLPSTSTQSTESEINRKG